MRWLWWRRVQQYEQFGVCQWTRCAAPPVANRWSLHWSYITLTLELKQSLKPEAGGGCLFSEAVFDQCCGDDLCRWQKLLLLSEQSDLDLAIHMARVQIAVGLITRLHGEVVILMCNDT